jgi:hypothetical protein
LHLDPKVDFRFIFWIHDKVSIMILKGWYTVWFRLVCLRSNNSVCIYVAFFFKSFFTLHVLQMTKETKSTSWELQRPAWKLVKFCWKNITSRVLKYSQHISFITFWYFMHQFAKNKRIRWLPCLILECRWLLNTTDLNIAKQR